jgi:hypothetical protein
MTNRGMLITHRDESWRPVYYTVLDSRFDSVVIVTQSDSIAKFWKHAVDKCDHRSPYNIWEHYLPKKD